jgi:hypothetical protein
MVGSAKRASFVRAQAVCSYDQLSADIPRNQILKATLRKLSLADGIYEDTAHELRILLRKLNEVSDAPLSRALFRHAQLTRNSRHYDLLLHVCRIVLDHLLPGEGQKPRRPVVYTILWAGRCSSTNFSTPSQYPESNVSLESDARISPSWAAIITIRVPSEIEALPVLSSERDAALCANRR